MPSLFRFPRFCVIHEHYKPAPHVPDGSNGIWAGVAIAASPNRVVEGVGLTIPSGELESLLLQLRLTCVVLIEVGYAFV